MLFQYFVYPFFISQFFEFINSFIQKLSNQVGLFSVYRAERTEIFPIEGNEEM